MTSRAENGKIIPSLVLVGQLQRTLKGQHHRTPVTTKHEKRLYANPLFAVSYGSFQGRPLRSLENYPLRLRCVLGT
jgi:hypothetical protein